MSMGQPRSSQAIVARQPAGFGRALALRWGYAALRALTRAADRLLTWQERARQRRALECLSDHMLRDIGLSRADVMAEATKRFWQP